MTSLLRGWTSNTDTNRSPPEREARGPIKGACHKAITLLAPQVVHHICALRIDFALSRGNT